ncbi:unnamed protein product [Mycena citricolor]|uniref:DDE-1 domain-containing protein n=1 Tax=Mycena citricolor TaxID=2018698 RepID=A0AAD2HCA7_9AGAR|nr:unnamed protein product [Mycena citricolor]
MRVEPDCIYGMDESGFPTGYTGKERVVGTRGTKTQHKQGGASRQNITTLVTIRGDGKMVVPPMVIFPGANFQSSWNKGNTINAFISRSLSGWTDHDLGYEWLSKVFEPSTGANGRTRVLLLDGHSSHYSEKFLAFAREHKIVLLGYPPHCTHRLQGLDVCDVAKADFMTVWAPAYKEALMRKQCEQHFELQESYHSTPTSSLLKTWHPPRPPYHPGHGFAPPTRLEQSAGLLDPPSPCTPARCLGDDDNHNKNGSPTLWTPSKKMRSLYAHLGASSSGSLLLSTPKITSRTNPISEPVIESMPRSLLAPDWSLAGPSLGDSSWKSRVQALNTEKENKNAEREKRKAMRKDKRTAKAALEEEWAGIKKDHAAKVAAWEQKCTDLKQTGFKKKDLPPNPSARPSHGCQRTGMTTRTRMTNKIKLTKRDIHSCLNVTN